MSWGPQPDGHAALPAGPPHASGTWLLVFPIVVGLLGFVFGGFLLLLLAVLSASHDTRTLAVLGGTAAVVGLLVLLAAAGIGLGGARAGTGWFYRRAGIAVCWGLLTPPAFVAYSVGYLIGARLPRRRRPVLPVGPVRVSERIIAAADPLAALTAQVEFETGRPPGAVVGWSVDGRDAVVTAPPRGGVLVLGPPGSGKTSAVLIPSILIAPGACVSSSIKADVIHATAAVRARRGRVWHFDPGGDEITPPGVTAARWSPLVSIRSWEDALQVGKTMAEPSLQGKGGDAHFIGRATDWIQVLLYAAHLKTATIGQVADWALAADTEDAQHEVATLLDTAEKAGDAGAGIAVKKLLGLIGTPDRERGSIISTMVGLLRVYDSTTARTIGQDPNFDPAAFVRSTDTLYITARPDKQTLYAPLLAALLEQIRFETYDRTKAEQAGLEAAHPHVTFALDEANTTAPIPLPAIISEAGGQGLHIIVGIQALSPAIARWGEAAKSFLTLFPTKVIFRGVFDPDTVKALAAAAGEYDRQLTGYSRSTTYLGKTQTPLVQINPTTSIHRQAVLTEGDITNIPAGQALVWDGPTWTLLNTAFHYQAGVWTTITRHAQHSPAAIN